MLMLTAKKEWLLSLREGRLRWLVLMVLILLTSAFVASFNYHQTLTDQKAQVNEAERKRWINQGDKNPHSAAHYGVYVIKPNPALSVLDPGLSAYQGEIVRLEGHKQHESLFRRIEDAIPIQRFGELTPGFIIQMLLPLLIILCGFHLVAGERESGTLKQLLANGVSPTKLVWAKIINLSVFASLLLLPLFVYVIFVADANSLGRSLTFILGYTIYTLIWALLTVVVSIYSANSRRALLTLLIFWVGSCLIIPKLVIAQAAHQAPMLSAQAFQSRLDSEVYTPERLKAIEQFKQDTLAKHQVSSTADLPFSWSGAQLQFGEEYGDKAREYLYAQRDKNFSSQGEFYQLGSLLSPFIALQTLSMASASSDHVHHQLFISAVEKHRRLIQKTLNNDLKDNGKSVSGYVANKTLWGQIPVFSFKYPSLITMIAAYKWALISFLLWGLTLITVTLSATKRLTKEGQL